MSACHPRAPSTSSRWRWPTPPWATHRPPPGWNASSAGRCCASTGQRWSASPVQPGRLTSTAARSRLAPSSWCRPAACWTSAPCTDRVCAATSPSPAAWTCREVLGSRSTFILGGFGGMDGATACSAGDEIVTGSTENLASPVEVGSVLAAIDQQLGAAGDPRPARRAGPLHRRRGRRVLRRRVAGGSPGRPHRGAADRPGPEMGPRRRWRGGTAPVQPARLGIPRRRHHAHRRHRRHRRQGRPQSRRLRRPGRGHRRRPLEARPAATRGPAAAGADHAAGRRHRDGGASQAAGRPCLPPWPKSSRSGIGETIDDVGTGRAPAGRVGGASGRHGGARSGRRRTGIQHPLAPGTGTCWSKPARPSST